MPIKTSLLVVPVTVHETEAGCAEVAALATPASEESVSKQTAAKNQIRLKFAACTEPKRTLDPQATGWRPMSGITGSQSRAT